VWGDVLHSVSHWLYFAPRRRRWRSRSDITSPFVLWVLPRSVFYWIYFAPCRRRWHPPLGFTSILMLWVLLRTFINGFILRRAVGANAPPWNSLQFFVL
jgi:hypothetical protein